MDHKRRVLVVEDDLDILDSVRILLEMENYSVKATQQADKVQSLMHNFKPDVVVMDLLLSGTDGSRLCRQIRSKERVKHTPIVMMSAHPSAFPRAKKAGATDFVEKPFEISDLLNTIERNL